MRAVRIYLFFLFGLIGAVFTYGQDKTDSLLKIVQSGTLRNKTDALNELCLLTYYNEPRVARGYALSAIQLAMSADYTDGLAKAYNRLGIVYDISGNYDSSVICYNIALKHYQRSKNDKGIGSAYNNLGLISWKHGKLNDAIKYFDQALNYFEKIGHKEYLSNTLNNISLVYTETKDYTRAVRYAFKALKYYRELGDEESVGGTYTNLSNVYEFLNRFDSAEYYIVKAIDCHSKSRNDFGLSIAYNDYGLILSHNRNYPAAVSYFAKSLSLKQKLNEEEGIGSIYVNMASNYEQMGQSEKAFNCLNKALQICRQQNMLTKLESIYTGISEYYKHKNNADSVYKYLQLTNAIKDSIYTTEFETTLAEAQTRYETREKEFTIKEQKFQLDKKSYYIYSLACILILALLIFYFLIRSLRYRQKNRIQAEIIRQQDYATRAVLQAEENERQRVASDLHDSVGQMLSAIKMNLSVFKEHVPGNNQAELEKISDMLDESCKEVRAISHNMMPNSLIKNGLVSAVKEFINQINSMGLKVNLETSGLNSGLPKNTETVLYRVIQECVSNVIKHANADKLDIQMTLDTDGTSITIEDNGRGFNTSVDTDGVGLKNLKSRILFLKGQLDISSEPGKGTLIAIFIPQIK